jgi:hypothetical protein
MFLSPTTHYLLPKLLVTPLYHNVLTLLQFGNITHYKRRLIAIIPQTFSTELSRFFNDILLMTIPAMFK